MLTDDRLHISYPNGRMVINCREFFPAEKWRLRKLLKLINRGWETGNNPDTDKTLLLAWLTDELALAKGEGRLRKLANEAVDCGALAREQGDKAKKQAAVVARLAEAAKGRKRNSPLQEKLKAEKEKLQTMKYLQRLYQGGKRDAEKAFQGLVRKAEKLEMNIDMVREDLDISERGRGGFGSTGL